jgi:hypothetical protein
LGRRPRTKLGCGAKEGRKEGRKKKKKKKKKNLKGRDHSEDLGVSGKIILKWILSKYGEKVWTVYIWFRLRASGGLL